MNLRKENWKGFYNAMPPFVQRWADVIMYRQSIPDALSRFLTAEEKRLTIPDSLIISQTESWTK
jgi:hypothetical protein